MYIYILVVISDPRHTECSNLKSHFMSLHITGLCIKGSCDFVDGIPSP